jgi:hypothetical protein
MLAASINWTISKFHRLIVLMMDTVIISETSVNFYRITRRNNPDSYLHTGRRQKLKIAQTPS